DRSKIPFGEGAGLDVTPPDSAWKRRFDEVIPDRDFLEGRVEFADFNIRSKEELFYIRSLAQAIDISRVPHLRDRAWISFSMKKNHENLKAYAHFSLYPWQLPADKCTAKARSIKTPPISSPIRARLKQVCFINPLHACRRFRTIGKRRRANSETLFCTIAGSG